MPDFEYQELPDDYYFGRDQIDVFSEILVICDFTDDQPEAFLPWDDEELTSFVDRDGVTECFNLLPAGVYCWYPDPGNTELRFQVALDEQGVRLTLLGVTEIPDEPLLVDIRD